MYKRRRETLRDLRPTRETYYIFSVGRTGVPPQHTDVGKRTPLRARRDNVSRRIRVFRKVCHAPQGRLRRHFVMTGSGITSGGGDGCWIPAIDKISRYGNYRPRYADNQNVPSTIRSPREAVPANSEYICDVAPRVDAFGKKSHVETYEAKINFY